MLLKCADEGYRADMSKGQTSLHELRVTQNIVRDYKFMSVNGDV